MRRGLVIFACILETIYIIYLFASSNWTFEIGRNLAGTIKTVVSQVVIALFLIFGILSRKSSHKDEVAED